MKYLAILAMVAIVSVFATRVLSFEDQNALMMALTIMGVGLAIHAYQMGKKS